MSDELDSLIDPLIRDHFKSTKPQARSFNEIWSEVTDPDPEPFLRIDWRLGIPALAGSLVIAIAVGTTWVAEQRSSPVIASESELMHALASTTRWRAPSDGLLEPIPPLAGWRVSDTQMFEFLDVQERL